MKHVLQAPDREFLLRVSYLEIYNEVSFGIIRKPPMDAVESVSLVKE